MSEDSERKMLNLKPKQVSKLLTKPIRIEPRRADNRDLVSLVAISRGCFTDHIRWQVDLLAKKYWKNVLESPSSETWIWLANGDAAGFAHILTDVGVWVEKKRDFDYGFLTKLVSVATHPRLVSLKIKKMISLAREEKNRDMQRDESEKINMKHRLEFFNPAASYFQGVHYGQIHVEPEKVIWVERAGVLPEYRKLGLALQILRFSEERAKELGRHAICGVIEETNKAWCWMHERLGYVPTHYSENGSYTYTKILDMEGYKGRIV